MAITPYLYYEDVAAALKFLTKGFGLRRFGVPMRSCGKITHAAMKVGDDVVMMGSPPSGYRNPKKLILGKDFSLARIPQRRRERCTSSTRYWNLRTARKHSHQCSRLCSA